MALKFADRVKETTTTTGTGSITLAGTKPGFRTFNAAISNGDTCYYCIADAATGDWEVGLGTFTANTTLARTTVQASSNSGSAVSFAAGTKDVFLIVSAAALAGFATLTGTETLTNKTLTTPKLTGIFELVQAGGNLGTGTLTVVASTGTLVTSTLTGNGTIIMPTANVLSGYGWGATIVLTGGAGTAITRTNWGTYLGTTDPGINFTSGKKTIYTMFSDGTTTWYTQLYKEA